MGFTLPSGYKPSYFEIGPFTSLPRTKVTKLSWTAHMGSYRDYCWETGCVCAQPTPLSRYLLLPRVCQILGSGWPQSRLLDLSQHLVLAKASERFRTEGTHLPQEYSKGPARQGTFTSAELILLLAVQWQQLSIL